MTRGEIQAHNNGFIIGATMGLIVVNKKEGTGLHIYGKIVPIYPVTRLKGFKLTELTMGVMHKYIPVTPPYRPEPYPFMIVNSGDVKIGEMNEVHFVVHTNGF